MTIALLFDGIVRSRLGNDMEAGAMSLPSSSEATAVGCMACLLVIALCLAVAAALSRSDSVRHSISLRITSSPPKVRRHEYLGCQRLFQRFGAVLD